MTDLSYDKPVTRSAIARDLRALGVQSGGIVMVHTSMSAIGWVIGGAESVMDADPGAAAVILADAGHLAWVTGDIVCLTSVSRRLETLSVPYGPAAVTTHVVVGLGKIIQGDPTTAAQHITTE